MRILFVSPYVPSVVRVRPYNWIRALARQGHRVHLVALRPPEDGWAPLTELKRVCSAVDVIPLSRRRTIANGLLTLATRQPLQRAYARSPVAERYVTELGESGRFDIVHVEHLRGVALASGVRDLPVVWDAVDSISALFADTARLAPGRSARWMARLDLARTRRFEARAPGRFARTIVTSRRDAQAFLNLAGGQTDSLVRHRIEVIANGVDTEYFTPDRSATRDAVVFSGKLSYHANAAAALRLVQRIMPLVWAARPRTPVILAGKDPSPALQQLTADPRVTVTGFLPDLRPILARAAVAACPLVYGAGIQNKVLEAMACGVPVVTTAAAGLALTAIDGSDIVLADNDEAFAEAIRRCLDDAAHARRIGEAGRAYVERAHRWPQLADRLAGVYQESAAAFSAGRVNATAEAMTAAARDRPESSRARTSPN